MLGLEAGGHCNTEPARPVPDPSPRAVPARHPLQPLQPRQFPLPFQPVLLLFLPGPAPCREADAGPEDERRQRGHGGRDRDARAERRLESVGRGGRQGCQQARGSVGRDGGSGCGTPPCGGPVWPRAMPRGGPWSRAAGACGRWAGQGPVRRRGCRHRHAEQMDHPSAAPAWSVRSPAGTSHTAPACPGTPPPPPHYDSPLGLSG